MLRRSAIGSIFFVGSLLFLVGAFGWYFRKPTEEGALGTYDSMLEAIAPGITLVGAATLLFGVVQSLLT